MDDNIHKEIAEKVLSGNELKSEKIQSWSEKNPYNKQLIDEYSVVENVEQKLKSLHYFNPDNGWNDLQRRQLKSQRSRKLRLTLRIAVAVIAISMSVYLFNGHYHNNTKDLEVMLLQIKGGGPKAMLTLSSGEEVELSRLSINAIQNDVLVNVDSTITLSVKPILSDVVSNNKLSIPRGGEYKLKLNDGTEVWLNSESEIIFPSFFADDTRRVEVKGEVYFDVAKDTRPFIVNINGINIEVLGTKFNVYSYPDENTQITLSEGSISLTGNLIVDKTILKPGNQFRVNHETGETSILAVDPNFSTAWRHSLIYFENETIAEVARKLSRWYSVDIVVEDEKIKTRQIYGVIKKYEDISQVINMLKNIDSIDFKFKGDKLLITN